MGSGASCMAQRAPVRRKFLKSNDPGREMMVFSRRPVPCVNFLVCNNVRTELPACLDDPFLCGACNYFLGHLDIQSQEEAEECCCCFDSSNIFVRVCVTEKHRVCLQCFAYPIRNNEAAKLAWKQLTQCTKNTTRQRNKVMSIMPVDEAVCSMRDVFGSNTALRSFMRCLICRGDTVWCASWRFRPAWWF
jgi:hypothetical protein